MTLIETPKIEKMRPDLSASEPLYAQIADKLRQLIIDGEVTAGEALPSERSLQEITGTSRVTIRRALGQLIDEGFLRSRRGVGTYIASRIEQSGEELTGFSADTLGRGETPASIWLHKAVATPTDLEADILRISKSDHVLRLGRVRLADGVPLAIEHALVPASLIPDISSIDASLYQALREHGSTPTKGTQKIGASDATAIEAGLLSIAEGDSVLRIERFSFRDDGTPIEYTRSVYRGDRYIFVSELHGTPK